jgi:anionic cell wall polymer biosynthesis LytR-Cps2A-Psr (LCP) family protein
MAKMIAGKFLYGALCLCAAVLLVVAGYAHRVVAQVDGTAKGVMINGSPAVGAMNILVMGLESRTNYEGQTLSRDLLAAMHAGSVKGVNTEGVGSQDTNTLILIHIFAGGKKAVGFSISRDDLVTFPQAYDGQREGKIDGAYAYAYSQYISGNIGKESNSDLYLHANQAGQAATIATVQSVTGQHIDHFVEVNLAGFYYLAAAFGGLEVCIMPAPAQGGFPAGANLTDEDKLVYPPTDNSGFNAFKDGYSAAKGGAQYLHLAAAQALAFVRARDTLPGVDLSRTKRQQATIDYIIYELKHEGAFADLSKLNSLLSTADQYLITDAGFNLLDFATDMQALDGQHLNFATLPYTPENNVPVPGYPGPQDVNIIDVPKLQHLVATAFNPPPAAPSPSAAPGGSIASAASAVSPGSVTVDVYNGDPYANGLAGKVSQALSAAGYRAGKVGNSTAQAQPVTSATQVFYGAGSQANAQQIALDFGATAKADGSLPADRVEVLIGAIVTQVPTSLLPTTSALIRPASGSTGSGGGASEGAASADTGSGALGGTVSVPKDASYGIPCVY